MSHEERVIYDFAIKSIKRVSKLFPSPALPIFGFVLLVVGVVLAIAVPQITFERTLVLIGVGLLFLFYSTISVFEMFGLKVQLQNKINEADTILPLMIKSEIRQIVGSYVEEEAVLENERRKSRLKQLENTIQLNYKGSNAQELLDDIHKAYKINDYYNDQKKLDLLYRPAFRNQELQTLVYRECEGKVDQNIQEEYRLLKGVYGMTDFIQHRPFMVDYTLLEIHLDQQKYEEEKQVIEFLLDTHKEDLSSLLYNNFTRRLECIETMIEKYVSP